MAEEKKKERMGRESSMSIILLKVGRFTLRWVEVFDIPIGLGTWAHRGYLQVPQEMIVEDSKTRQRKMERNGSLIRLGTYTCMLRHCDVISYM